MEADPGQGRWDRIKEIFADAIEKSPQERAAFLHSACWADEELRAQVEQLLDAHAKAESHIQAPTIGRASTIAIPGENPGDTIGPFRLLELIGEGGMGVVYKAEQRAPVHRIVALKLIKAGMDTRQIVARFDGERQALAMMNHPNVAAVYEAGVAENGRPYFVMEYVRGEPITDFCDRHRYTIHQRLELFTQACEAIQHAHQKAVIHRDIKPSNLLVELQDAKPLLKVIDFGVAKATGGRLTERTMFTEAGQLIGTPEYMSPEQAGTTALDVDTRTDIYSLGVVLYELLSGALPLDPTMLRAAAYEQIQKMIREVEPPRPSTRLSTLDAERVAAIARDRQSEFQTLQQQLRRELEWIPLKAMRKDPTERYRTAADLARDIQNYLLHQPLVAAPQSLVYQCRKFLRRHRAPVAAVLTILVLLIVAVIGTSSGLLQAMHARDLAARQRDRAEANESRANDQARLAQQRLWDAYLAQARALRRSDQPGRRSEALDVISRAAAIRATPELRDEYIACSAIADLRVVSKWRPNPPPVDPGVAVDARGARYATCDDTGNIRVFAISDQKRVALLRGTGSPLAWVVRFSPDGRYLAAKYTSGALGTLRIWDLQENRVALTVDNLSLGAMDFDRAGDRLASACPDGKVVIYDLRTGTKQTEIPSGIASPYAVRFSSTGRLMAVSSHSSAIVRVLEVGQRKRVCDLSHPAPVRGVAFSPDESTLAAAGADAKIYLWDLISERSLATLIGHQQLVVDVAFNNAGTLLASHSWDGTTRLWDPVTGKALCRAYGRSLLHGGFSADDKHLAFDGELEVGMWEVSDAEERRVLAKTDLGAGAVSTDGKLLAGCSPDSVRLYDLRFGRELLRLPVSNPRFVAFHPRRTCILVSAGAGCLRWDIAEDSLGVLRVTPTELHNVPRGLGRASISNDGRIFAAVTRSGISAFRLSAAWDSVEPLFERPHPHPDHVSLSADGSWVACGPWSSGGVKVWSVQGGDLVADIPAVGNASVLFSPDNKWLVIGSSEGYRFFSVGSWKQQREVVCDPMGYLFGVMAFDRDTSIVALTRGRERELQLIDPSTGQQLASLGEFSEVPITFTPGGGELVVVEDRSVVRVWNLRRVREHLGALGLDWQHLPYVAPAETERSSPIRMILTTQPSSTPKDDAP